MNLLFPCDPSAPITQSFGENPDSYLRFNLKGHNGIDYALPMASPVFAVAPGIVDRVSIDPAGYGQYIKIDHSVAYPVDADNLVTLYGHLSKVLVKDGDPIEAGQQIALSGNSGNSTGPHLHFELRQAGLENNGYNGAIDPILYLFLPSNQGAWINPNETPATTPTMKKKTPALYIVINTVNVRKAPNLAAPVVGQLPRDAVIGVYDLVKKGLDTWAYLAPNLYCAYTYKAYTYLEPV